MNSDVVLVPVELVKELQSLKAMVQQLITDEPYIDTPTLAKKLFNGDKQKVYNRIRSGTFREVENGEGEWVDTMNGEGENICYGFKLSKCRERLETPRRLR